jgi:SAM-dependent methyltransferase
MAVKPAVIAAIVSQFGHPRGMAGHVAGWVMAHRPSNRRRNRWVVSLLDVRPADRVLEIGFGPGLAIAELSRRVGDSGHVYGIDHSEVMLRQATTASTSRNAARQIDALLRDAGYAKTRTETLDLNPPVVCVLAVNPDRQAGGTPA